MGFFSDAANLIGQALVFSFISLMIDPDVLPTYGGNEVSYLEFASIGIALGVFVQFALDRVAVAVRGEQLMGTLESVLMTPTSPVTIQLGSVAFDLLYIPIRTVDLPRRDRARLRAPLPGVGDPAGDPDPARASSRSSGGSGC